ncbi:MAG: hypothetical protein IKH78_08270 [Ruminococcus sp.]|nr:hypothetical protein [Ruminococcus sp.]
MKKWDALIALRDFLARYTNGDNRRARAGEYVIEILYGRECGFYLKTWSDEQENELKAICEALGLKMHADEVTDSFYPFKYKVVIWIKK